MKAKPLYLYAKEPVSVRMDGPALLVAGPGAGCEKRFPFCRISRIVISGQVSWSTEALLACANEGINVTFLSESGSARAYVLGVPSDRSSFVQHWRDFLDRPDNQRLYCEWRSNMRRRAIRFCALRMGFSDARSKGDPRKLLMGQDVTKKVAKQFKSKIRGLAQAMALEELTKLGFGATEDHIRLLISDLVTVVQWGVHPDLIEWQSTNRKRSRQEDEAVSFFERNQKSARFHARDFLHQLSRFLTRQEPD